MVGARFACVTVIENAGSVALSEPSDTEITMFDVVPTSLDDGVPDRRPVTTSKLAHDGALATPKRSVWPVSGSEAVGVKL